MCGDIIPLPQYAFMAWCSVYKSTGTAYLYLYLYLISFITIAILIKEFTTFVCNLDYMIASDSLWRKL
jgi:hypothetical protein